jgi:hypothetical protein
LPGIDLLGEIKYDYSKIPQRTTSGFGWINNKWFKGGNSSYLLHPEELYKMLLKLNPNKIWFQKMKYEPNYTVIMAKK